MKSRVTEQSRAEQSRAEQSRTEQPRSMAWHCKNGDRERGARKEEGGTKQTRAEQNRSRAETEAGQGTEATADASPAAALLPAHAKGGRAWAGRYAPSLPRECSTSRARPESRSLRSSLRPFTHIFVLHMNRQPSSLAIFNIVVLKYSLCSAMFLCFVLSIMQSAMFRSWGMLCTKGSS